MLSGKFIVDIDNPWSLVGYNLKAMPLYKWLIKKILLSSRCLQIRCMSKACQKSLEQLFGQKVLEKSIVKYPAMGVKLKAEDIKLDSARCRFLFVGTQFDIKGGAALLNAFIKLYSEDQNCSLDLVTHLPDQFLSQVKGCKGINYFPATFKREEIHSKFMLNSDILLLPTYVESFGMVALEAMSFGLGLIATDVYALSEMAINNENGFCLTPPLSIWDGVMPSIDYYELSDIKDRIRTLSTVEFEEQLYTSMKKFLEDREFLLNARKKSLNILEAKYSC